MSNVDNVRKFFHISLNFVSNINEVLIDAVCKPSVSPELLHNSPISVDKPVEKVDSWSETDLRRSNRLQRAVHLLKYNHEPSEHTNPNTAIAAFALLYRIRPRHIQARRGASEPDQYRRV